MAESFRQDYDLQRLVETMLRSNRFFSTSGYRCRIKSPIDFAVGTVRSVEELVPTGKLADDVAKLGENLLYPPTLAGWAGGTHWVNPVTIIGRRRLAEALLSESELYGPGLPLGRTHGEVRLPFLPTSCARS